MVLNNVTTCSWKRNYQFDIKMKMYDRLIACCETSSGILKVYEQKSITVFLVEMFRQENYNVSHTINGAFKHTFNLLPFGDK